MLTFFTVPGMKWVFLLLSCALAVVYVTDALKPDCPNSEKLHAVASVMLPLCVFGMGWPFLVMVVLLLLSVLAMRWESHTEEEELEHPNEKRMQREARRPDWLH